MVPDDNFEEDYYRLLNKLVAPDSLDGADGGRDWRDAFNNARTVAEQEPFILATTGYGFEYHSGVAQRRMGHPLLLPTDKLGGAKVDPDGQPEGVSWWNLGWWWNEDVEGDPDTGGQTIDMANAGSGYNPSTGDSFRINDRMELLDRGMRWYEGEAKKGSEPTPEELKRFFRREFGKLTQARGWDTIWRSNVALGDVLNPVQGRTSRTKGFLHRPPEGGVGHHVPGYTDEKGRVYSFSPGEVIEFEIAKFLRVNRLPGDGAIYRATTVPEFLEALTHGNNGHIKVWPTHASETYKEGSGYYGMFSVAVEGVPGNKEGYGTVGGKPIQISLASYATTDHFQRVTYAEKLAAAGLNEVEVGNYLGVAFSRDGESFGGDQRQKMRANSSRFSSKYPPGARQGAGSLDSRVRKVAFQMLGSLAYQEAKATNRNINEPEKSSRAVPFWSDPAVPHGYQALGGSRILLHAVGGAGPASGLDAFPPEVALIIRDVWKKAEARVEHLRRTPGPHQRDLDKSNLDHLAEALFIMNIAADPVIDKMTAMDLLDTIGLVDRTYRPTNPDPPFKMRRNKDTGGLERTYEEEDLRLGRKRERPF